MEEARRWVSDLLGVPVEEGSIRKPPDAWGVVAASLATIYALPLDPLTDPAITLHLEVPGEDEGHWGEVRP